MQSFRYRDSYNVTQAASMALGAVVVGGTWWRSGQVVTLALALVFVACGLIAAARIGSDQPALSFADRGASVRTPFGTSQFLGSEVTGIYLQMRGASNILTMPFGGSLCLCFQTTTNAFLNGRIWLGMGAIEQPPGGAAALLDLLNHIWREATGEHFPTGDAQDALPA